ncbi:MAG: carbohydrate-binding protein, partial [Oscillospiraceae bacterium]|nr:carbohydrate-binding protein [Oscillospiraceae bacterium]
NLFIDVSNTEVDRERYSSDHAYCGNNFDKASSWKTNGNASSFTVNNTDGTLSMTAVSSLGANKWPDVILYSNVPVDYSLANAEVYQVRFKTENFVKGTQYLEDSKTTKNINPYINFRVKTATGEYTNALVSATTSFTSYMSTGDYITLTVELNDEVKAFEDITSFYCYFGGIESDPNATPGVLTIDYIYVGTKADAPAQDSLYFDFTGSEDAKDRYEQRPYGNYNYDTQGWQSRGDNMNAVSYNTTNGTISATSNGGTAAKNPNVYYLQMIGLNYDPSNAEVFKARIKLENFVASGTPEVYVDFIDREGTIIKQCSGYPIDTADLTNGNWFTASIPVTAVQSCDTIGYVRLNIKNVTNGSSNGKITVNYLYVGPEDDAPAGDHLYFDFTNTPADKARYAKDPAYSGYNFDDDACWTGKWDANGNHADTIVDNVAGTITSSYPGSSEVYFYTTYNGKYGTKTLKFNPKTAEVWEVRFKLNAALSGSANVRLNYAADGSADILYTEKKPTFTDTKANEYITITQPLTATFKGKSQIVSLRLAFNGIPAGTEITVDYIFVGAQADLEKVRATNNTNWQTVNDFTTTTDDYQDQEFIAISREETSSQLETIGAGPKILNEYYGIRNGLSNYNNNIPLSFSHRGSFRTSSENSYLAVYESLQQGMDGVEIDLMITSDKVVVLSHDESLKRTTGDDVKIADVTWNSIKDYPLEVGNGTGDTQDYTLTADEAAFLNSTLLNYVAHYGEAASSGGKHYTARLDDILEMVKKKAPNAILTFDKVNSNQDIFVYSFKAAYDAGMLKNVFFKLSQNATTLKTWASAAATACGISQAEVLSSMQMLWVIGIPTASSVNSIKTYRNNGINVVAVEGSWTSPLTEAQEDVIINTFMPYCRENNIDFWPTVIGPKWAGQLDDDETTWLYYLEYLGVDGLMTDRPEEFGAFMHYYNGASRASSELIQAEHFQSYNLHSGKFYMNEAADVNHNKLVNEMYNGDYLEYRNITFTGSENTLYVTAKGINGGGSLKFYVDNMNEESCFATISFGTGEYCVTRTATMDRTVSKGTHKIYVQALGNDKMALLSLDSYTFQKQSDDHYLFFDFNNTPEDQNRYKKAIYGSNYNFDIRDYWATYSSDNSSDSVNKTNFTVENGVAKVKVGDDFEGEKVYCGPKFMTTKTYGVFPYRGQGANAPLRYVPSENDYLVVRFKLDNVIAGSDYTPMLFMEYHWNDASGADNTKYEDLKADYNLVTGQWQTVAVPVSATFKNAKEITSLGLRFTGILSSGAAGTGTVTIDYIYVGPLQQADHLLIDFEENLGTYEDSVYGGVNYDLSSKWTYSGSDRNSAPTVADGEISTTTTGASTASYYHIKMTTANLTYVPGDDDYCEIRFKVSNATGDGSGKDPEVLLYFSPDLYDTKGTGGNNSNKTTIPITTLDDGEYHTIRFPLDQTYYRDAGIIRSIALMFNKFSKSAIMTFTVDYVYVGPLSNAPSDPNNSLFFDFTNTAADRERYDSYTYGGYNFDMPGEGYWATNATAQNESTNETNYVIDNEAGTATVAVGDTSEGENLYGPKFQTTNTYGKYPWNNAERHAYAPLHYKPTGKEYIQVRFKIEDCETVGELKFQMDYHFNPMNGSNYMKYAGLNKAFTYTEGEWVTVTHSLSGISTFQNADEILSVGLRFVGIRSKDPDNLGHVVIDYIYVGPEEGLPSMDRDTYGYDSSYIDDSLLSDSSSMFVQGKGIPNIVKNSDGSPKYIDYAGAGEYTEASFTFTGTGFDLISRTGVNQGLIRAVIFDRSGNIVKNVSVNNKGETELYQIPV